MLLSSVNFVAKPKAGKGCKGREEKDDKKIEIKDSIPDVCEQCRTEALNTNSVFQFPNSSFSSSSSCHSSGYASESSIETRTHPVGDRVTVTTSDDFCVSVDQFYYTMGLRAESKCDSTCVFRKRVLATETLPNGRMETVAFILDCDRDFYLTTNKARCLELNYCSDPLSAEDPDERIFCVYYTRIGQCLIQPKLHKNYYLHHLDRSLSVQQFNLNWRCPEEYYFHFNAVPEPLVKYEAPKKIVCTHLPTSDLKLLSKSSTHSKTCGSKIANVTDIQLTEQPRKNIRIEDVPERFHIDIAKYRQKRNKGFFSDLFLGCLGGRSVLVQRTEVL